MKAFKQINLNIENRLVFSYAAILCFLCSFIILNPLFGQTNEEQNPDKPEVRINIEKEFDEQGNIIVCDSTYSWFWSGKEIADINVDSIFEKHHINFKYFDEYFERNHFEPFTHFQDHDWQWSDIDSNMYSDLDGLFDEGFMERFDFDTEYFQFNDSTINSFFDYKKFDQKINTDEFWSKHELFEKFNEDQEVYFEIFKEYQKEHQKLVEKYFGDPNKENEKDTQFEQNKYSPKNIHIKSGKTGRI